MTHVLSPHWQEKVVFSPAGPQPLVLTENAKFKVIIAGLEPGQKIPPHPEAAAVYQFLDGSGWMQVDDIRFAVAGGATVITPEGATRGIEAGTRLAFLATRLA